MKRRSLLLGRVVALPLVVACGLLAVAAFFELEWLDNTLHGLRFGLILAGLAAAAVWVLVGRFGSPIIAIGGRLWPHSLRTKAERLVFPALLIVALFAGVFAGASHASHALAPGHFAERRAAVTGKFLSSASPDRWYLQLRVGDSRERIIVTPELWRRVTIGDTITLVLRRGLLGQWFLPPPPGPCPPGRAQEWERSVVR